METRFAFDINAGTEGLGGRYALKQSLAAATDRFREERVLASLGETFPASTGIGWRATW